MNREAKHELEVERLAEIRAREITNGEQGINEVDDFTRMGCYAAAEDEAIANEVKAEESADFFRRKMRGEDV